MRQSSRSEAQSSIAVASFEDIATALSRAAWRGRRLPGRERDEANPVQSNDDIDSLRDLASGAPVVRAVNDLA